MGSLTAHLLEPGDHGRLRFHPSCPVCRRERLYGTLSSEPVVSRRAQALLAGGALAISSPAPAVAIAQERDRQFEGVASLDQAGGPELDDPSFDPGGDTALSFDTAPAPTAPEDGEDSGYGAPLDAEPTVDFDARATPLVEMDAPLNETGTPPTDQELGVPPVGSVPSAEPGAPTSAPPRPPVELPPQAGKQATSPQIDGPTVRKNGRAGAGAPASPRGDRNVGRAPSEAHPVVTPSAPSAPAASAPAVPSAAVAPSTQAAAASTPVAEPAASTQAEVATPAGSPEALDGNARSYVVQPGDSLWSIAKRLLGRNASAGRIAREVNRLWTLNRDRIATGDPDLLPIGTRLELR